MNEQIIVSIVSGKGGCGKTRIATALAKFLSEKANILLIDMDLHNQGLTTLMNTKNSDINYTVYDLLNSQSDNFEKCKLNEIHNKVYFLPSINQNANIQTNLMKIEKNYTPELISSKLNKLLNYLTNEYLIDCVIFDNTGLPDAFSIGSSLCSNNVLIITQPDNISWKGALNFYTTFKNNDGNVDGINFIVNNIPKKYTYSNISDLFGFSFNFLAFIPFEYGIFESFGRNPFKDEFLTNTQFYKKVGYIATKILQQMDRKDLISENMNKYSTESIKKDLTEKYTTSHTYDELRVSLLKKAGTGMLLIFVGLSILLHGVGISFELEDLYKIFGLIVFLVGLYYYMQSGTKLVKLIRSKHKPPINKK